MPLQLRSELPDFQGVTEWVNGETARQQLLGKPVLVHFWAASCSLCEENLPVLNEWREQYGRQYRLQLVGVHVPRSENDTDIAAVKAAVAQYELKHPIAIDNDHAVTRAYRNQCVPAYYLFDGQGHMRFFGTGEKAIGMVKHRLRKLWRPTIE